MENSEKKQENSQNPKPNNKGLNYFVLMEAGIEFAIIIAVPLISLILAGKWLDSRQGTHFYVVIGILLALGLSAAMIYKKIKEIDKLLKNK